MKLFISIALSLVLLAGCTADKPSESPAPSMPGEAETPAPEPSEQPLKKSFESIGGLPVYGEEVSLDGIALSVKDALTALNEKISPAGDPALPQGVKYAFMLDGTVDVNGEKCFRINFGELIYEAVDTNADIVAPLRVFAVSGQKDVFEMNIGTGDYLPPDSLPEIVAIPEILNLQLGADAPKVDLIFYRGICKVYVADDEDNKKLIQQIPCYAESVTEDNIDWFVKTSDLNFDGNTDLLILSSQGVSNIYYDCYLWDQKAGYFLKNSEISALSSISIDSVAKTIHSYTKVSATDNFEEVYTVNEKNALVFVSGKEQTYDAETKMYTLSTYGADENGIKILVSEQKLTEDEIEDLYSPVS